MKKIDKKKAAKTARHWFWGIILSMCAISLVIACSDDEPERDLEGESAPDDVVTFVENATAMDDVTVEDVTWVEHDEGSWVVAASADTPDGTQVLTFLYSPAEATGDGFNVLEPLNDAAQEWAPLAPPSEDTDALETGERLMVGS